MLGVLMLENADTTLITAEQVRGWTQKNPVLSRVREMRIPAWINCSSFWPIHIKKRWIKCKGWLFALGARVIIPIVDRSESFGRSSVWWPKLDQYVERLVKICCMCQEHRNVPAAAPLHPLQTMAKIACWLCRTIHGKMFFVLIHAHSKWMDVYPVNSATGHSKLEFSHRIKW